VSGHDFNRAEKRAKALGFSPCGIAAKTRSTIFVIRRDYFVGTWFAQKVCAAEYDVASIPEKARNSLAKCD
jgi:hypothetical protein